MNLKCGNFELVIIISISGIMFVVGNHDPSIKSRRFLYS